MSSKRDLKKEIKAICADLALECIFAKEYVQGVDIPKMQGCLNEIAQLQDNATSNVNITFDKRPEDFENSRDYNRARSLYFKQAYESLRTKVNDRVQEIVRQMNAALPNRKEKAEEAPKEA